MAGKGLPDAAVGALIVGVVTLIVFGIGAQQLYVFMAQANPLSISSDEYVRTKPSEKWLRITEGRFEREATLEETRGHMVES